SGKNSCSFRSTSKDLLVQVEREDIASFSFILSGETAFLMIEENLFSLTLVNQVKIENVDFRLCSAAKTNQTMLEFEGSEVLA
ncbi:hypothetical protein P5673_005646, partial [Acropora cervicornis]